MDATELLRAWNDGDESALNQLVPLIEQELHRLARAYMQRERQGHTLQATAVVHEAFVKLVEMNVSWQDRAHFFAVAARQMRRILVDHAKSRFRDKRGGTTTGSLHDTAGMLTFVMGCLTLLVVAAWLARRQGAPGEG